MDNNKENTKSENMFVGCMFLGMGLGLLFGHIPAGTIIGMGVGFIVQQIYSK